MKKDGLFADLSIKNNDSPHLFHHLSVHMGALVGVVVVATQSSSFCPFATQAGGRAAGQAGRQAD